jgi:hypothetical protein
MGTPAISQVQKTLFQTVQETMPDNQSLVAELADLLEMSIDSVYRRIRGETSMTVDELVLVCNKFKISFDSLLNMEGGMVAFHYNLISGEEDFKQYLSSIISDLKMIRKSSNQHVTYAAVDVPIFHYFRHPELTAFKMYYWLRSIVQESSLQNKKFDHNLVSDEFKALARELHQLYSQVPSTEIWTETTINSFVKQIEFCWESGFFSSKEDALLICEQSEEVLTYLQKAADYSTKYLSPAFEPLSENTFKLYLSDIEIGNNCIQITYGKNDSVFLSHLTFNKLFSTSKPYNDATKMWLNNLISKSTLISGVGEKQRNQFFIKSFERLKKVRSMIEG